MSPRVLIVGVSESGKSTLARRLISGLDIPIFVFDPIGDEWLDADFVTSDFSALVAEIKKTSGQPRIVIVDESGDVFQVGQRENHWLFTRGRHDAILPIAIAQRMTMIAPNVRSMATDLYLFRSALKDCETLAADYGEPGLLMAAELPQGQYFHSRWQDGKKCLTHRKLW